MITRLLVRSVLTASLLAPLATRASTVEERLAQLEQAVGALEKENAALKQQLGLADATGGSNRGATVAPQGKEMVLAIGGFMQANAEFGGIPDARFPANDRFLLRRARIGLRGTFAEFFDFNAQTDLGANSLAPTSAIRAQASDVHITWTRYPAAIISIGQFKTPFGYEQLVPDTRNPTVERSLPNDLLTLGRQVGVMANGALLPDRLSYAVGVFNGTGPNNSGNDNDQFLYVGRLNGTIVRTERIQLGLGGNAYTTRDTGATFSGDRDGYGLDAQLSSGPALLQGEYLRMRFRPNLGADTSADGWSVLAGYMLLPQKLQALVRYETYDPKRDTSGDETTEWTAGLNYFIRGDDIKFTVNYLVGDPPGGQGDHNRLLTRMQIVY